MSPMCARSSENFSATAVLRLFTASLAVLVMFCLASSGAFAATCTLTGTVSTWSLGSSSNWYNSGNWSPTGIPNSSGTSVCITDGSSTVTLDSGTVTSVNDLQLGSGNTLTTGSNLDLFVYGTQIIIANNGQFILNGGGGPTDYLGLENNVTLSGAGALTLTVASGGGSAIIQQQVGGLTLTNQSTIQGAGIIGNGGLALNNSGTINANSSGQTLTINGSGGTTNSGLMEASSGGYLQLQGITINNAGGNITANSGSTVQLFGSTVIQGGTLNNNGGTLGTPAGNVAYLDGSTGAGAVTINGTYFSDLNSDTFVAGTIVNNGQILLSGGGGPTTVLGLTANTTLQGGGTVTLSTATGGGSAIIQQQVGSLTLTNVNNTIQGAGIIGNGGLALINQETINANSSGQALLLNGSGGITNSNLMEASSGGVLQIQGITVNNAGGNITAASGSTVEIFGGSSIQGGTLNNNGGAFLGTPNGNSAILDGSTASGPVTINGTYTSNLGSDTYILGTINNKNNFQVNAGGGPSAQLLIDTSNVTLQGGGTVTLSTLTGGGTAYIDQAAGGLTLTNVNNTIQGEGEIGNNGLTLVNHATINANSTGIGVTTTLTIQGATSVTNTGLMEATNSGVLQINGEVVNNAGANITASGSSATVEFYGGTQIQGGTLNNNGGAFFGTPQGYSAYLDGSTNGALTINGTYTSNLNTDTYILGTINNKNNFQVNAGGGPSAQLLIDTSNVTLQGGGTVTLSTLTGGGTAYIDQAAGGLTLTNVNNTIQGEGEIGNNGLTVLNQATINANSTGGPLTTALTIVGASVTNTGLMEATNSGVLQIDGVIVNNAGGNITANGGSATVEFFNNADIQGGTLNNNGGAFFGTPQGYSAYLDGSTNGALTINGTYTSNLNTDTYILGTINNKNNFQVNGGGGPNTQLIIDSANLVLQGGGTLTLSTLTGGGDAILDQAFGGITLTNVNNVIQGEGIIGQNGLTVLNQATIDANSMGGGQITTLTIQSASVTNTGLMEATNSGVLQFNGVVVNNAGGNITASGGGATVEFFNNADIQGGTLNNNGGAFFGTPQGYSATLDGSTASGAVTINGTYTSDFNSTTHLLGTINNAGNILVNGGGGPNTVLEIDTANVTLTGGGTVTLSTATGGGSAYIYQAAGGFILDNVDNTIQGAGIIGQNGLSVVNGAAGTILANAPGQTLLFNGGGTETNNGTFQANAGSALVLSNVAFTNYAANTLTGGTYNIYGTTGSAGTLEIDALGNTGGEIINNAATIYLNGPNSNFVDAASKDALSNFSNNMAAGSFTITNGRNFTSPSTATFANAGAVTVGSSSTFTTGGTRNYNQSGGSTQLNGTLTAGGGGASFNGGVLYGNGGIVNANVSMAGTIAPAATISGSNVPLTSGALTINGNYTQTSAGIFNLGLGGLAPGSGFGFLSVSGNALIDGTLNVNLLNTYRPVYGNTFTFLTTGGSVIGNFANVNGLNIGGGLILSVQYGSNYVELSTGYSSTTDLWNGGTGPWSNGSQWSIGVPQPAFDTIIYSGGADLVTMDVGSSTVKSLTVGGPTNGFYSTLTDGGTAQTLSITNGLTVGQQGILSFTGSGSAITAASLTNNGSVIIGTGATLTLTSQPLGITDAVAGSQFNLSGTFTAGGGNGFANLNSIEGAVNLYGQNFTDTPGSTTLTISNTGSLSANSGTTLKIAGALDNLGTVSTDPGGNTLTITGALTNSGSFKLLGPGDTATMAGLGNSGYMDAESGSTFQVNGNATNSGSIYTSFSGTGGSTFNVTGTLNNTNFIGLENNDTATIGGAVNNSGSFQITGGSNATFTSALTNSGTVDLENASALQINSTVSNSGTFSTSANGGTGFSNVTVTGLFTNQAGGQLTVKGNGDLLKASGGLVNNGTVTVSNGATIDPPFFNNLGTLSIDGTSTFVVGTGKYQIGPNFIQLANGTFGEMINSATAFGVVNVAGSASLNGTLDILLKSGYNPTIGTSFTYLLTNPGALSGTYSTILNDIFNGTTEKWVISYNYMAGDVQLTAASNNSATPEPGTFLMLGSGLIGVAYSARRRFKK